MEPSSRPGDPIEEIARLLEELHRRNEGAPICLSTMAEGFPNARFVDLKGVSGGLLLFGTDERSTKAQEFERAKQVSLCAWWTSLQVQVRVRGTIQKASSAISDREFSQRNVTARAIASVSIQSQPIASLEPLREKIQDFLAQTPVLVRPSSWWIYGVSPQHIEILKFSEDRIHARQEYRRVGDGWTQRLLSP